MSGRPMAWTSGAVPAGEAVASDILDRLERWGDRSTADAVRLILAAGVPISLKALADGRWTVELREGGEDLLTIHGKGSYGAPLRVRDLDARAILRSPARRTAITAITGGLHLQRWRDAAAALGVASETPADVLRPSRLAQCSPSGATKGPHNQATRSKPPRAAPEVLGHEDGERGEAMAVAATLEALGNSETARWLLG